MIDKKINNLRAVLILLGIALIFGIGNLTAQTPSGTTLKNQGKLNYQEPVNQMPVEGRTNEYLVTVLPVNIISVTPDNPAAQSLAPNTNQLAPFQVCNNGNTTLNSLISAVTG